VTALDENIRRVESRCTLAHERLGSRDTSHRHPPTCRATGPQEDLGPARLSLAQKLASIVIPTRAASARQPARRTSDTTQTRPFFSSGSLRSPSSKKSRPKTPEERSSSELSFTSFTRKTARSLRSLAVLTLGASARPLARRMSDTARRSTRTFFSSGSLASLTHYSSKNLHQKAAHSLRSFAVLMPAASARRPAHRMSDTARRSTRTFFSSGSLASLTHHSSKNLHQKAAHSLRSFAVLMPAASARRPAHRMSDTARRFRPPRGLPPRSSLLRATRRPRRGSF